MNTAFVLALFCTVVLLAVNAYFLMGSVPLLILRHDVPMDAQFVRAFFATYFRIAGVAAVLTALSFLWAHRPVLAACAGGLAVLTVTLRRLFIPRMDALRPRLQAGEALAIPRFRRLHLLAILATLAQLVATVWTLVAVSIQAS